MCSQCGRPRHESFDAKNEERYEATLLRCHSCAAQQRRLDSFHKAEGGNAAGLYAALREIEAEEELTDDG